MAPGCLVTLSLTALLARLDVVVDAGLGVRGVGRAAQDFSPMVMMIAAGAAAIRLLSRLIVWGADSKHRVIHARSDLGGKRLVDHCVVVQRLLIQIIAVLVAPSVLSEDTAVLVRLLVPAGSGAPVDPIVAIKQWRLLA